MILSLFIEATNWIDIVLQLSFFNNPDSEAGQVETSWQRNKEISIWTNLYYLAKNWSCDRQYFQRW